MVEIIGGMLLWLATETIAVGMAGGGHGWNGPAALSLPLVVLYPVALVRLRNLRVGGNKHDAEMLVIAVTLDAFLAYNVGFQEPRYFAKAWELAPGIVSTWFALWVGWQVIALATLIRAMSRRAAELPDDS